MACQRNAIPHETMGCIPTSVWILFKILADIKGMFIKKGVVVYWEDRQILVFQDNNFWNKRAVYNTGNNANT